MFCGVLLICVLVTVSHSQIDGPLKNCAKSGVDKKACLEELFNNIRPLLKDGVKELGLPSYDPLVLPNFNVQQHSREVNYTAALRNLSFHNLINFELINIESDGRRAIEEVRFPDVLITADYSINGTFLNRPIRGCGFGQVTTSFMHVLNVINYRTFIKDGVKRCEIVGVVIKITLGDVHVHAEGLAKESVTNQFLNAHSKLVTKHVSRAIEKMFEVHAKNRYDNTCKDNPPGLTDVIFV